MIGMNGIFIAAAVTNILLGLLAYWWLGRNIRVHGAKLKQA
jgi:hypothetical protein